MAENHVDEDDDVPQLSAETFSALSEFYQEQEEREKELHAAQVMAAEGVGVVQLSENWQLSQFWYDDETSKKLAAECVKQAGENGKIACISSPSVYVKIKNDFPNAKVKLFEFDKRFATFGEDFVFYDYNSPLQFTQFGSDSGSRMDPSFDVVLADPPYLSEECLTKTAITIRSLATDKIIVCTGATMENLVGRLMGLQTCSFEPRHSKNLANEFLCYANYELDSSINAE